MCEVGGKKERKDGGMERGREFEGAEYIVFSLVLKLWDFTHH